MAPTGSPRGGPLYKISTLDAWEGRGDAQDVPWAAVDEADGFVHLSALHQVRETARRHFASEPSVVLVELDPQRIDAESLRWEASRGGDLFPHVYGTISADAVTDARVVERDAGGDFIFPCRLAEPLGSAPSPEDVVRRFERLEAAAVVDFARQAQRSLEYLRAEAIEVDCAAAGYFGPDSPLNGTKGWGLDGAVSLDDLRRVETFFRDRGVSCRVELPSHGESSSFRNYAPVEFKNVFVADLRGLSSTSVCPGFGMSEVGADPERAAAWGALAGRGFFDGASASQPVVDFGLMSATAPRTRLFFVELDGEPVGACGLRVDHEVVWLFGASVLPEARGRGLHRASVETRLELGRASGCRWAKLDAAPGGRSHRNALRCGFQVAYLRVVLELR